MKKFLCALSIIACALLCGCCNVRYPNAPEYNGSKWVAQEVNLYFVVSEEYYDFHYNTLGTLVVGEKQIEVITFFPYGPMCVISKDKIMESGGSINDIAYWEDSLFSGDIGRGVDRKGETFTMEITERQPGYIDDSITTITFVREDMPEE